jgi:hypothetical protein
MNWHVAGRPHQPFGFVQKKLFRKKFANTATKVTVITSFVGSKSEGNGLMSGPCAIREDAEPLAAHKDHGMLTTRNGMVGETFLLFQSALPREKAVARKPTSRETKIL